MQGSFAIRNVFLQNGREGGGEGEEEEEEEEEDESGGGTPRVKGGRGEGEGEEGEGGGGRAVAAEGRRHVKSEAEAVKKEIDDHRKVFRSAFISFPPFCHFRAGLPYVTPYWLCALTLALKPCIPFIPWP